MSNLIEEIGLRAMSSKQIRKYKESLLVQLDKVEVDSLEYKGINQKLQAIKDFYEQKETDDMRVRFDYARENKITKDSAGFTIFYH